MPCFHVVRLTKFNLQAFDNTALNVVCNQEYAQAVPHVHYHIVPAPHSHSNKTAVKSQEDPPESESSHQSMLKTELLLRSELDDEEGERLAKLIQAKL
ncbi:hypothetical protein FRB90_000015 [Tulasnella sp. 427]|nr:hypothetical protein FRB90_000015 [Tulasnella sp. 427]